MPRIFIPSPIRPLTNGRAEVDVEGATVREAIDALDRLYPGVRARLRDGDRLAGALHVSIDDVLTKRGLDAPLRPESEVHFLPAIGGG
ncbi:MAG: MoaD/ThiS family protein [Isosphaeraceae bacterium]|nr:MoaD/ThiS family protein [Isosphaeraceae bacterium]